MNARRTAARQREIEVPDYIIIGGGTAGCVLAARLSADPAVSVLLIEAGPQDRDRYIHMPAGFARMTAGPLIWGFETTPAPALGGRSMILPQARVLGGGSSINAQVFTRGCPEDFEAWSAEFGCTGWNWDAVLPCFRRSERNDTFDGPLHGSDGPLGVSCGTPHPLTRAFVRAAQQAGLPLTADFNGARQEGCGFYQTTTRGGRRSSAATAYLRPALKHPNLSVRTGVAVLRVTIEAGRATGVEIAAAGGIERIAAGSEVIVTAGAIGSPKLLLLSGLGPADALTANGIPVRADLPDMGRNLHDHMDVDVIAELSGPHGIDRYKKRRWQAAAGLQYLLLGTGPAASNLVEGGAFWWGDRAAPTPDLQLHFLPGAGVEAGIGSVPGGNGCTLNSYFLRPRSRGTVALRSADPAATPLIDLNPFHDPYDLARAVDGVELCREILRQPALAGLIRAEHLPGAGETGREALKTFARRHARSAYHPVGTCRMGGDDRSGRRPKSARPGD